jgi:hypothetical protein
MLLVVHHSAYGTDQPPLRALRVHADQTHELAGVKVPRRATRVRETQFLYIPLNHLFQCIYIYQFIFNIVLKPMLNSHISLL